jgi:hypothetical protein
MQKDYRRYLKMARSHGATIESGRKHYLVRDSEGHLVMTLSRKGVRDTHMIRSEWRKRGWL